MNHGEEGVVKLDSLQLHKVEIGFPDVLPRVCTLLISHSFFRDYLSAVDWFSALNYESWRLPLLPRF